MCRSAEPPRHARSMPRQGWVVLAASLLLSAACANNAHAIPHASAASCTSGGCCGSNGTVLGAGTVCRAAAGPCDVSEVCDGVSNLCPADAFRSSATVCRPAAGECDVAETCTGAAAACPPDRRLGWSERGIRINVTSIGFVPASSAVEIGALLELANVGSQVQPLSTNCTNTSAVAGGGSLSVTVPVGGIASVFVNVTGSCYVSRLGEASIRISITYVSETCTRPAIGAEAAREEAVCPSPFSASGSVWLVSSANGSCVDRDECTAGGSGACPASSLCVNTYGSYLCQCGYGYADNGTVCVRTVPCGTGAAGSPAVLAQLARATYPPRSDRVPNLRFGQAVALSGNGTVAGVGAPLSSNGKVYLFTRDIDANGMSSAWALSQTLSAGGATGVFGAGVALDGAGLRAFVTHASGANATVVVYDRASNGTWLAVPSLTLNIPLYNTSASLATGAAGVWSSSSGETLAVLGSVNNGTGRDAAVGVFHLQNTNGTVTWRLGIALGAWLDAPSAGATQALFSQGYSTSANVRDSSEPATFTDVAISGDGRSVAVGRHAGMSGVLVARMAAAGGLGTADWNETGIVILTSGWLSAQSASGAATAAAAVGELGYGVALDSAGVIMVLGGERGAVVLSDNGRHNSWEFTGYAVSDTVLYTAAIDWQGSLAVLGAPQDSETSLRGGEAFALTGAGSGTLGSLLPFGAGSSRRPNSYFGASLALSGDGTAALAGAPGTLLDLDSDVGAVQTQELQCPCTPNAGLLCSVEGGQCQSACSPSERAARTCPSGYVRATNGDGCVDSDECASASSAPGAPTPCASGALCTNTAGSRACQCAFGTSGDGLLCAASTASCQENGTTVAASGAGVDAQVLLPAIATYRVGFGQNVALNGNGTILAVAGSGDLGGADSGAYVFRRALFPNGTVSAWEMVQFIPRDGLKPRWFGFAVALSEDATVLYVTARGSISSHGVLYVYEYDGVSARWMENTTRQYDFVAAEGATINSAGSGVWCDSSGRTVAFLTAGQSPHKAIISILRARENVQERPYWDVLFDGGSWSPVLSGLLRTKGGAVRLARAPGQYTDVSLSGNGRTLAISRRGLHVHGAGVLRERGDGTWNAADAVVLNETALPAAASAARAALGGFGYGVALNELGTILVAGAEGGVAFFRDPGRTQAWEFVDYMKLPSAPYVADMSLDASTIVLGHPQNGSSGAVAMLRVVNETSISWSNGNFSGGLYGASVTVSRANGRYAAAGAPSWSNASLDIEIGAVQTLAPVCGTAVGQLAFSGGVPASPVSAGARGCINFTAVPERSVFEPTTVTFTLPPFCTVPSGVADSVSLALEQDNGTAAQWAMETVCSASVPAGRTALLLHCSVNHTISQDATLRGGLCNVVMPPWSGVPGVFAMGFSTRSDGVLVLQSNAVALSTLAAGTAAAPSVSCPVPRAGASCLLSVALYPRNPVPQNGAFSLSFAPFFEDSMAQRAVAAVAVRGVRTSTTLVQPAGGNTSVQLTPCDAGANVSYAATPAEVYSEPAVPGENGAVELLFTNLTLPPYSIASVGTFAVTSLTAVAGGVAIDVFPATVGFAVSAGEIASMDVELSNRTVGSTATVTVTGVLTNPVPAGGAFVVTLPALYNISSLRAADVALNLSALASVQVLSPRSFEAHISAAISVDGAAFKLVVASVQNPSASGELGAVGVGTRLPPSHANGSTIDEGAADLPALLLPGAVETPTLFTGTDAVFAGHPVRYDVSGLGADSFAYAIVCGNETAYGAGCSAARKQPLVAADANGLTVTFWDTVPYSIRAWTQSGGANLTNSPVHVMPLPGVANASLCGARTGQARVEQPSPVGSGRSEYAATVVVCVDLLWQAHRVPAPVLRCSASNGSASAAVESLVGEIVQVNRSASPASLSSALCVLNDTRVFGTFSLQVWVESGGSAPSPPAAVAPLELACAPGYFALTEVPLCSACATGTYSNVSGATACTPCPAGEFTALDRATACTPCSPGTQRSANSSSGTAQESSCVACERGKFSNSSGASVCEVCAPGTFARQLRSTECELCSPGTAANTTGRPFCAECEPGTFADAYGLENCRVCPAGTIAGSAGQFACSPCPLGHYNGAPGSQTCAACPPGADCSEPGTSLRSMQPLRGFWRPSQTSLSFYTCAIVQACAGGTAALSAGNASDTSACATGYGGVACGECADGYFRRGYLCYECLGTSETTAIVILFMLALSFIGYRIFRPTENVKKSKKWVSMTKILIGFVQASTLAQEFEVVWPESYSDTMSAMAVLKLDLLRFSSFSCLVSTSFYGEIVFALVFPIILAVILYVWHVVQIRTGLDGRVARRNLSKNIALLLLLVYPSVTGKAFAFFNCRTIEGVQYLKADYSIECGTSEYQGYTVFVAVAIVLVTFGIPLFLIWKLYAKRDRLDTEVMQAKYGTLYVDFRDGLWFWELVRLFHKVLLWVVVGFVAASKQVFAASIVGMTMLLAHGIVAPYEERDKNAFETYSLLVQFLNFFFGMAYAGGFVEPSDDGAAVVLIMFQCSPFFVLLLYGLWSSAAARQAIVHRFGPVLRMVGIKEHRRHAAKPGATSSGGETDAVELGDLCAPAAQEVHASPSVDVPTGFESRSELGAARGIGSARGLLAENGGMFSPTSSERSQM